MKIVSKATNIVKNAATELTSYWKKPSKGNYVSYKEIANYSIGGMGQNMFVYFIGFFGLGAGNLLLGSAIGIRPMHLQYMATIQTIVQSILFIVRGKMVDSTRTRWGRFRPYMALMGFPLLALSATFLFLPFERMPYTKNLILVFSFAMAISVLLPLFTDTYGELQTVISPNSKERAKVITISSLVYSFAPTIYYLFVPILTELTGGFTKINTYKFIILPLGVLGILLSLFAAFGCKERVVSSKSYVQKVKTFQSILQIWKNKYWWIRNIAGLVGFLEGAFLIIFSWMFIYGTQDMVAMGLANTILGTASGISMAITPYLLTKLGNRKILLFHNIVNVILIFIMTFTLKIWVIFFVIYWFNTVVNQLQIVYNPALHAEVKDYQQYISGTRMDFMFGAAGLINMPIQILSGYVIPFVYESMGITNNYDIMYDPRIRNQLFYVLCILSIIGALLNLIPFFFYRLSRQKHKTIIAVLQYRAVLEDEFNGVETSPYAIRELVDSVNHIMEVKAMPVPDFKATKAECKAVSRAYSEAKRNKAENLDELKLSLKEARAKVRHDELLLYEIEGIKEIWDTEIAKHDGEHAQHSLQIYRALTEYKTTELAGVDIDTFLSTQTDAKLSLFNIKFAKKYAKMQKLITKNYPNGVTIPDPQDILDAEAIPVDTKDNQIRRAETLKHLEKVNFIYNTTFELYLKAVNALQVEASFKLYPQVAEKYDFAVTECARLDKIYDDNNQKEKAARLAEIARIKQERFDRMPKEKQEKVLAKKAVKDAKKAEKARIKAENEKADEDASNDKNTDANNKEENL